MAVRLSLAKYSRKGGDLALGKPPFHFRPRPYWNHNLCGGMPTENKAREKNRVRKDGNQQEKKMKKERKKRISH